MVKILNKNTRHSSDDDEYDDTDEGELTPIDHGYTPWSQMEPLPIPTTKELTVTARLIEVQGDELNHYQMMLEGLKQAWRRPYLDVDEICKLSLTTVKVLDSRRNMLFPASERDRKLLTAYDA